MTGQAGAPPSDPAAARYVLRLYVTGSTPRSARAVENLRRLCEERLAGRYVLEVVDIYQRPEAAREAQLVAAPTLVRLLPEPLRRLVGDLSDRDRVLRGLDLLPAGGTGTDGGAVPEC